MITADSERSRKRLHVAKKALAVITKMDLPAKSSLFEGFTYKVWQLDKGELSGGRIVSPPGIMVTLSQPDGTYQFTCDSFVVGAAPARSKDNKFRGVLTPKVMPVLEDGLQTLSNTPKPEGLGVGYGVGFSQTVSIPFAADLAVVYSAATTASGHHVTSMQINHMYSHGGPSEDGANYSPGWTLTHKQSPTLGGVTALINRFTIVPTLATAADGFFEAVAWKFSELIRTSGSNFLLAVYLPYTVKTASYAGFGFVLLIGPGVELPPGILEQLNQPTPKPIYQLGSHYVRTDTDVRGFHVVAIDITFPVSGVSLDEFKWTLMIIMSSLATPSENKAITMHDIGAVFDPLIYGTGALAPRMVRHSGNEGLDYNGSKPVIGDPPATDWKLYWKQLQFILGSLLGWPVGNAVSGAANNRSALFPDDDGNYYSVTMEDSALLGFKFSRAGVFSVTSLSMPAQVMENLSAPPNLRVHLLARAWDEAPSVYLCTVIQNNDVVKGRAIIGLHIGSPFTGVWDSVPLPAGAVLYSARAIPMGGKYGFIAIGIDTATDSVYPYRVHFKPADGPWVKLSPIPHLKDVAYDDYSRYWDAILVGDNALAVAMAQVVQHPVVY